ncbi:hypothetical protein PRUPE_5G037300 [Prunus persica]|uniref:Uncharacterized protein n=1 Tax=Prunus persica TaxID=3760 RepID=A0A251P3A5_PRUPE|nr:hypothetical protein PRUPE_5G037300 [Prunus persica]
MDTSKRKTENKGRKLLKMIFYIKLVYGTGNSKLKTVCVFLLLFILWKWEKLIYRENKKRMEKEERDGERGRERERGCAPVLEVLRVVELSMRERERFKEKKNNNDKKNKEDRVQRKGRRRRRGGMRGGGVGVGATKDSKRSHFSHTKSLNISLN